MRTHTHVHAYKLHADHTNSSSNLHPRWLQGAFLLRYFSAEARSCQRGGEEHRDCEEALEDVRGGERLCTGYRRPSSRLLYCYIVLTRRFAPRLAAARGREWAGVRLGRLGKVQREDRQGHVSLKSNPYYFLFLASLESGCSPIGSNAPPPRTFSRTSLSGERCCDEATDVRNGRHFTSPLNPLSVHSP